MCGSWSSEVSLKISVYSVVVLGRDTAKGCGLEDCIGHDAGIGQLVVGTRIGGGIAGSVASGCESKQSNILVIGLRSHCNKSGPLEVKFHNPFTHDLCLQ